MATMISVIIITYNSAEVLPACLEALALSDCAGDMELIFIDNASTDSTWAMVQSYVPDETQETETPTAIAPFARIVAEQLPANRGYAFANNRGLARATGDCLLLLNPDTEVGRETISACASRLQQANSEIGESSEIGVVGCQLLLPDGRLDRACRRSFPTLWNSFARLSGLSLLFARSPFFAGYNLTYLPNDANYAVDCVSGAFLMISRSVHEHVGGLDEDYFMYGEDIDWCYRIRAAGYRVWYEGSAVTVHHKGGNGGKRSAHSLYHFYNTMLIYYRKHHAARYPTWLTALLSLALKCLYACHLTVARIRGRLKP